jgi:hypothetical protein
MINRPYKWNISKIQKIAEKRGGECLSKTYYNPREKLNWRCDKGHVWEAVFDSVRRGSWCLQCRENSPLTLKDIQETAKKRGGECLSKVYINASSNLKWRCAKGHAWEASANNIRTGSWCPECARKIINAGKRLTIELMRKIAKTNKGRCLSREYAGIDTKLKWECSKGHKWEATPYMVRMGYWCRVCSGHPRLSIEDMKEIAEERGGRCLSVKYVNDSAKLQWKCAREHKWEASANSIRNGKWCPECSSSRSERIARAYFEQIFENKFPVTHPRWLRVNNARPMQLDGYNDDLKLAFEYQGKQHYDHSDFYHSKVSLKAIQKRDRLKKQICKRHGILLIRIPWNMRWASLIPYLKKSFKENKRRFPQLPKSFKIDISTAYSPELLKYMQDLARKRRGRCLSKHYIDARTPMKWECAKGHRWETAPTNIQSGGWCPECAGVKQKTIEDAIRLAKSKKGEFLSSKFKTSHDKYQWQCAKGHTWKTTFSSINAGSWCRFCSKTKYLNISEMQKLAKIRGGKCLSKRYVNSKTLLTFQCNKGHKWKTRPEYITQGRWCHVCGKAKHGASQRLTIDLMRKIAQKNGGQCLSKNYTNARTKLIWKCAKGHAWEAVPDVIRRGCWCRICYYESRKKRRIN